MKAGFPTRPPGDLVDVSPTERCGDARIGVSDVADIYDAVEEPDRFGLATLEIVGRLVSSDLSTFNHSSVGSEFANSYEALRPRSGTMPDRRSSDFVRLHADHPLITRFARSAHPPPTMWTDVVDFATFAGTELYEVYYRPLGVRHQVAIKLAGRGGFMATIALSRTRPFSEGDRDRLAAALPHLRRGYTLAQRLRRAEVDRALQGGCTHITANGSGMIVQVDGVGLPGVGTGKNLPDVLLQVADQGAGCYTVDLDGHPRVVAVRRFTGDVLYLTVRDDALDSGPLRDAGLSPREASVALALAEGGTNAQIARRLSIRVGTVRKHLERVYVRLGVDNRSAAAAEVHRLCRTARHQEATG